MAHIFFLCPQAVLGSVTLGRRGRAIQKGHCIFSKASPTSVSDPHLMALFAIELTQGPNLRFPNLHVTQAIKRPNKRSHEGPALGTH